MGSCVSLNKDPDSALGFRWRVAGGAKGGKLYSAPSPSKQPGPVNGGSKVDAFPLNGNDGESGRGFRTNSDFGSKEEDFFDTKGWLDSDCEDDFYSVRGDFTPSRGSTPVHEKSIPVTPRLNKTLIDVFPDTTLEPSPRKKLAQLLQEDVTTDGGAEKPAAENPEKNMIFNVSSPTNTDRPSMSMNGTPYQSGANSVSSGARTPSGELRRGKVKTGKTIQCCLPNVVPSFGSSEKKKARQSPDLQIGV